MSVILVDSCVITDLADTNSDWYAWSVETLEELDSGNVFVINSIIYTECSIGYQTIEEVESLILAVGCDCRGIPREAQFKGGKAFIQYR